ncbi:hypothetical protein [Ruminococcus flavefaciens]|uniref:Lipoprotein n=1 Tax=Ruminococcus flavefaciens TaxID=1265 RepID=A0A1M7K3G9_RUMFL|nr:hypothetical protein [Ruminococcus flavefaciens]SHM59816.1 hypothetical protein SAMN04487860_10784 [Ruminococcus flavefaciens]
MKRVFISIVALAATLNLCACGDNSENKSKNREKSNSKVETQHTTEKEILPDVANKYTMVDAFDKIDGSFSGVYPTDLSFFYNTSESDYNQKISYDCTIKVADTEKIIIEVKADYSKYEADLEEMGYKFETDSKMYEYSTGDILTNLLREDQLTDENVKTIKEHIYSTICSEESKENILGVYALLPKEEVFLSDFKCYDNGETGLTSSGYEKELLQKIPSKQFFVISKSQKNFSEETEYEINSFEVRFEKGKVAQCTNPNSEYLLDENGRVVEETIDETNYGEYFNKILAAYEQKGYSFDVKEITDTMK